MYDKIRKICGVIWTLQGIGYLFLVFLLWRSLSSGLPQQILDPIPVLIVLGCIVGLPLLFYGILQFNREKENAVAGFFARRIPAIVLSAIAYVLSLAGIAFFTVGEIHLKAPYAIPIAVIGLANIAADVLVNIKQKRFL